MVVYYKVVLIFRKIIPDGKWLIRYWNEKRGESSIESWFDKLDQDQLKSVSKELKMLAEVGNKLRLPHSKPLGKSLFELRERKYGLRLYYGFHGKHVVVLLAAGDKSSQKRDIKIASERLKVINEEGL